MRAVIVVLAAAAVCAAVPAVARADLDIGRTCNGSPICDGWFAAPVSLRWAVTDATSTTGCLDVTVSEDTAGNKQSCFATDGTDELSRSVTIRLDQTPPSVIDAVPNRPPDHDGWYTHPVTFTPEGADATSGVLGCESVTYAGPDGADARIVATCRDVAGHSASRVFPLSYDATPPNPVGATVKTGDRVVRLSWPASGTARVMRTPGTEGSTAAVVYEGPGGGFTDREVRNGRRYRYVLTLSDEAGNSASRELSAVPDRRLLTPARRAIVAGPPLLSWTPVRNARYYNVQVFRKRRKILSAWPRHARLQLKAKWRFRGKTRRLRPGRYRWYVWPGKGPRAANRYGERIGRRSFTITPPQASSALRVRPR